MLDKIRTPQILVAAVASLVVRGSLNVRDHKAATFKRNVTDRRLLAQTEGWRDLGVKVCDDPKNKGKKVVLQGNISVSAALEGFGVEPTIWEKLIPGGKISVLDYGKLTEAQMQFMVKDHGENDLTLIEVFLNIERALVATPGMTVDDVAVTFNGTLNKVVKGRKVELTGKAKYDRKALADRWRGLLTNNWMQFIQMRAVKPVYEDHIARLAKPGDKDAGKLGLKAVEWKKLHKAWTLDKVADTLDTKDEEGFPPEMAKAMLQIRKDRVEKANATKAPATVEATPLTKDVIEGIRASSLSATIKSICDMMLGNPVPEHADLEAALVKAEQTEGNDLHAFFNKVTAAKAAK